jgi:hypothetical protein
MPKSLNLLKQHSIMFIKCQFVGDNFSFINRTLIVLLSPKNSIHLSISRAHKTIIDINFSIKIQLSINETTKNIIKTLFSINFSIVNIKILLKNSNSFQSGSSFKKKILKILKLSAESSEQN